MLKLVAILLLTIVSLAPCPEGSACIWSRVIWQNIQNTNCFGAPAGYKFADPDNCVPECPPHLFPAFCAADSATGAYTCQHSLPKACLDVVWPNTTQQGFPFVVYANRKK